MPTHSNDNPTRRLLNPAILSPPGPPAWIPACAGMTTRREQAGCHPDSPFAMPGNRSFLVAACRNAGLLLGHDPGLSLGHARISQALDEALSVKDGDFCFH